ncbi:MAG: Fic family protein [Candidatus Zixiibacteriota bacterium]
MARERLLRMDLYKIEKPDLSKFTIDKIVRRVSEVGDIVQHVASLTHPEYLYWDVARYKTRPKGISAEEFWAIVKFFRKHAPNRIRSQVKSESGEYFSWQQLPGLTFFLHQIDLQLGGTLAADELADPKERRRFISRGIIEEAIASSQLEGANTTRKAAKLMIIERRVPRNRSEQMILNNYQTMISIEEELKDRSLDLRALFDLHINLTKETLEAKDIGRLRTDRDRIVVLNSAQGVVYHVPPKERFLRSEIERLIAYANDEITERDFVHPVLKAVILHFWLGYLHPFVDGNGRLARALFYWYLLRKDYWAFSYIPLSRVIKNSPAQYRNAYVYSEQDDHDLTYFVDYNVRKITLAKKEFEAYVRRKQLENLQMASTAKNMFMFNERQMQLLRYLHKNPTASTTIVSHARVYEISLMTARKDLKILEKRGLLSSRKVGRQVPYFPTKQIEKLFRVKS